MKLHAEVDIIEYEGLVLAIQAAGDILRTQGRDEKFVVPLEQGYGRDAAEPLIGNIVMLRCDDMPADLGMWGFLHRAAAGFGQ